MNKNSRVSYDYGWIKQTCEYSTVEWSCIEYAAGKNAIIFWWLDEKIIEGEVQRTSNINKTQPHDGGAIANALKNEESSNQ